MVEIIVEILPETVFTLSFLVLLFWAKVEIWAPIPGNKREREKDGEGGEESHGVGLNDQLSRCAKKNGYGKKWRRFKNYLGYYLVLSKMLPFTANSSKMWKIIAHLLRHPVADFRFQLGKKIYYYISQERLMSILFLG